MTALAAATMAAATIAAHAGGGGGGGGEETQGSGEQRQGAENAFNRSTTRVVSLHSIVHRSTSTTNIL